MGPHRRGPPFTCAARRGAVPSLGKLHVAEFVLLQLRQRHNHSGHHSHAGKKMRTQGTPDRIGITGVRGGQALACAIDGVVADGEDHPSALQRLDGLLGSHEPCVCGVALRKDVSNRVLSRSASVTPYKAPMG